ncbi:KAP family P-loop NTPase fold protein [Phorcysia thermohydrogeniphila]|uniref:KAP-like P-loop domain-containing protein n=1 Tax=Phorcysia thermohydrogeniphila TaxID=936138 RepID=A0A4V2PDJ4_9BACT|nr:P-loop NTPase fold protein [Phorcysia thermohydrogeniphila]TCK05376.1 KAP-like P-loop domain-containing protein [Phorcysia thermohydrogeniphila]
MRLSFRVEEPMEIVKYESYGCEKLKEKDALGMEEQVEKFKEEILMQNGKFREGTVGIVSQYGGGKSFFLSLLYCKLKQDRNCIYVDISRYEHEPDVFRVLMEEILREATIKSSLRERVKEFIKIVRSTTPLIQGFATFLYPVALPAVQLGKGLVDTLDSVVNDGNLRDELYAKLSEVTQDMPLVVLIDNLDRCRPDYVLHFLASVKDILKMRGILFIVAYDKTELLNVIKKTFGEKIDVESYLRKYIAVEFSLDSFFWHFDKEKKIKALNKLLVFSEEERKVVEENLKEVGAGISDFEGVVKSLEENSITAMEEFFCLFPAVSFRKLELIFKHFKTLLLRKDFSKALLELNEGFFKGEKQKISEKAAFYLPFCVIFLLFVKSLSSNIYEFWKLSLGDDVLLIGLFDEEEREKMEKEIEQLLNSAKKIVEEIDKKFNFSLLEAGIFDGNFEENGRIYIWKKAFSLVDVISDFELYSGVTSEEGKSE